MKKQLLLLAPLVLMLTGCNSSVQSKVEEIYLKSYHNDSTIVKIENTYSYEKVSMWFIVSEKINTFTYNNIQYTDQVVCVGDYLYTEGGSMLRKIWQETSAYTLEVKYL